MKSEFVGGSSSAFLPHLICSSCQLIGKSENSIPIWRVVREVEGATLEMSCRVIYLGFESLTLRHKYSLQAGLRLRAEFYFTVI